jgi:hypothetical protein
MRSDRKTPKDAFKQMLLSNVVWLVLAVAVYAKFGSLFGFVPLALSLLATGVLMWLTARK